MEQYRIAEIIAESIINDGLAQVIFLQGPLARQEPSYAVDLYVMIPEKQFAGFQERRHLYLSAYGPLIYQGFTCNPAPLAIGVYENGLRINLHSLKGERYLPDDDILIIYDPKDLLAEHQKFLPVFSPEEIGVLLDSFCLQARDFRDAQEQRDAITGFYLACQLLKDYATLRRIQFEPESAKLGLKNYFRKIDREAKAKFLEILRKLSIDTALEAVKRMFLELDQFIGNLPIMIAEHINFDFYYDTRKLIMSIV
jgi:hypothetical protein